MNKLKNIPVSGDNNRTLLSGVPEGYETFLLSGAQGDNFREREHIHVCRDAERLEAVSEGISFFSPGSLILDFPAWDCLPYDRVSPQREVVSKRIDTLFRLANHKSRWKTPVIVLTTINAVIQKVAAPNFFTGLTREIANGEAIDFEEIQVFLSQSGFERASIVREAGDYAIRGGILDIFVPGYESPVRIELFGDIVEGIRVFDPFTQTSTRQIEKVELRPASEYFLDENSIKHFRSSYRGFFGSVTSDQIYSSISAGRRYVGAEHWLPLFHERMQTLFDFIPNASITFDYEAEKMIDSRLVLIKDYFDARTSFLKNNDSKSAITGPVYRPLPYDELYLSHGAFEEVLAARRVGQFSPFGSPEDGNSSHYSIVCNFEARTIPDFAATRAQNIAGAKTEERQKDGLFDALKVRLKKEVEAGKTVIITGFSSGSRERLGQLLKENGISQIFPVENWETIATIEPGSVGLAILGFQHGFISKNIFLITEQDILGERIVRPRKKRRRAEDFILDVSEISVGDLVVHVDHGIGRYEGLYAIDVDGGPHDCLRIEYAGDGRLLLPVENLEVLSRYGSVDLPALLDRLGGAGWQARKSRMKSRLRDIAEELIKVAADRSLKTASKVEAPEDLYQAFASQFPYNETEDQSDAIADTLTDLGSGKVMDRLVCGDVGFGKTEVALRAAFATVMSGGQAAVVVPTTLLSRQHFASFIERFNEFPINIKQLSRLVSTKNAEEVRRGLQNGEVDIVVGTHALLSKSLTFNNLQLLVIDEEQRFGVTHKERLKNLKADVHVLTLTATPIPRTLQMALNGVKELSLIGTPPIDRLAVRTFVSPFDEVMIREAIMREHFRGGQTFYVCPRVADMHDISKQLEVLVPEVKVAVAHGKMGSRGLEAVMSEFYDGNIDVLLSTQIIESGLDIPTANTMVIHRADMFGLAQLYQLRGRIGRSKVRAYCYLTLPVGKKLTGTAKKRLEVMQSLDTLGAGFALASHDLDIRGAGNLLGEEQSGHIREVGVELYQHMLEEAVAAAGGKERKEDKDWSPQINIGVSVLIPEKYVSDLSTRLGLYRRIAALCDALEVESFAAELIDRFGKLPEELENLLQIVVIKQHCRMANVEKIEAGPKGLTICFRNQEFKNPDGLIKFVSGDQGRTKLRPDHKLIIKRDWVRRSARLDGVRRLAKMLAKIAQKDDGRGQE